MNSLAFDKQQNLKSSNFWAQLRENRVNESAKGDARESEDGAKMRKPRRR